MSSLTVDFPLIAWPSLHFLFFLYLSVSLVTLGRVEMKNWNERIGNLFLSVSRRDALRKTIMLPGSSIQIKETLLKKKLARENIFAYKAI